jgi:hypothetical protein
MRPARVLTLAVLAAAFLACPSVRADDQKAVDALNAPAKVIQEKSKSWKTLFDAYVAMTAPPAKVGKDFNALTIWPGMTDWSKVKEWAAANGAMAKAIMDSQQAVAFALPYGRASVPPVYVEKGTFVGIGDGLDVYVADVSYLKPLAVIEAFVVAEMYRLGGEKKFQEAFDLGLATLRVLRQVADQHLLEEKVFAMEAMCDMASVQRDVLQTFLGEVPAPVLKTLALSGYGFIRLADGVRLRRLEIPEGDRVLGEALMNQLFDGQGQPDPSKFASAMGGLQARKEPLSAFGSARRWKEIVDVHGSLDATRARFTSIYDDWWRRWRVRYYDTLLDNPTVISRTNKMRYAMVLAMVNDIDRVFALRQRLNAELNGTVLTFGLAAAYRDSGNKWPVGLNYTYAVFTLKRFDMDPWDPAAGRWQYENESSTRAIETDFGRLQISGGILYARGFDKESADAKKASNDGLAGDFVAWPALRALSRASGGK